MPALLPPGTPSDAKRLLTARGLRAFGDGYVSLLLPFYLAHLGLGALEIGVIVTATLLGSGMMTLGIGLIAHRFHGRDLLCTASLLMLCTGVAMASVTDFWPLLIVAVVGTINPSGGDASVFLPVEQALLTRTATAQGRTALFARYSLIGALVSAFGSQAAALPALATAQTGITQHDAMRLMFLFYAVIGVAVLAIYCGLSPVSEIAGEAPRTPLGPSKRRAYKLAALFSLDGFGGGFAVQSLLALWLYQRFGLSIAAASVIFFWIGILTAFSHLIAPKIAERFGLVNTMVFTHLPANILCVLVPFMPTLPLALALLFARSLLGSMDVPARTSYVMAVVSPAERAAAAAFTAVPRGFTSALSPALAGYMLAVSSFGWPLVFCGALKIVYDLTLLSMFRAVKPPEEKRENT
jgi:MFS family permease